MKKLHVPALKEALVRALGLRGDVRLDLDGKIVPVMIAGTALETELATQVRVVNDLEDPAGVEFKEPVVVVAGDRDVDVQVRNTQPMPMEVKNVRSEPVPVELITSLHVSVYEDLSPYFWWRVLPSFKAGDDHYWAIGRYDSDDNDSHQFIWSKIVARSTDNDENWDNWELVSYTSRTDTGGGYTRHRFRDRSGIQVSGDSNPAIHEKYDANQPGAVGSILGKIRDLGDIERTIDHPSDSIAEFDLTGMNLSSGYRSTNVWGVGIRRLERNTPNITLTIAGYWLKKQ